MSSGVLARVRASFVEPGAQWLRVRGEEAGLELPGDTFSARDVATELWVSNGGRFAVEGFAPVDPYKLMVEAVSAAVSGGAVSGGAVSEGDPGGEVSLLDTPFLVTPWQSLAVAAVMDRLLGVGGAAPSG